jgi:DNA-directed RNA polymerase subunit RPC12/RpoP
MKFRKNKKYTCVFCSNKNETSKHKVFLCNDCQKIRNHIREHGIRIILEYIQPKVSVPNAPPY